MTDTPSRAAIYRRISDDREGKAVNVAIQEKDCRELAERLGWTLHPTRPVYDDNDRGASTLSRKPRPAYAALLAAVRAGEVDGILYWSNSRLTRRPREYADIEELVKETGVRLASVKSGMVDLTTADGRMIGGIPARVDAAEAERISERVMSKQKVHRINGRPHMTGTRPFGFLADGITHNEPEAQAIRSAADMVLRGASLGDVVRAWTDAEITPVTGGRWSRNVVKRALTRPRVAGLVEHRGEIVGQIGGSDGEYQPILDQQTWERVRAAISDRSNLVRARFRGREHLLGGFLTCGVCASPMKISARRDENGAVRADSFVSCIKENGGCGSVKRNLRLLEKYVIFRVELRLAAIHDDDAVSETDQERATLQAEREEVDAEIRRLRDRYTSESDVDVDDYLFAVQLLRKKQRDLAARLGDLDQVIVRQRADDPLVEWQDGDLEARRDILADLVETIVVEPIGKVGPARSRAMVPSTTKILWR